MTVMVCHDCCCGTTRKHPDVDHPAQRAALLACRSGRVRVREVECLDECDRSNVVLVRDHSRLTNERDTWLGAVHSPHATQELVGWVQRGGELPETLANHRFEHRRARTPEG